MQHACGLSRTGFGRFDRVLPALGTQSARSRVPGFRSRRYPSGSGTTFDRPATGVSRRARSTPVSCICSTSMFSKLPSLDESTLFQRLAGKASVTSVAGRICECWFRALLADILRSARLMVHTVFSVDGSLYHRWQADLLAYSHRKARQPGSLTRLWSASERPTPFAGLDLSGRSRARRIRSAEMRTRRTTNRRPCKPGCRGLRPPKTYCCFWIRTASSSPRSQSRSDRGSPWRSL